MAAEALATLVIGVVDAAGAATGLGAFTRTALRAGAARCGTDARPLVVCTTGLATVLDAATRLALETCFGATGGRGMDVGAVHCAFKGAAVLVRGTVFAIDADTGVATLVCMDGAGAVTLVGIDDAGAATLVGIDEAGAAILADIVLFGLAMTGPVRAGTTLPFFGGTPTGVDAFLGAGMGRVERTGVEAGVAGCLSSVAPPWRGAVGAADCVLNGEAVATEPLSWALGLTAVSSTVILPAFASSSSTDGGAAVYVTLIDGCRAWGILVSTTEGEASGGSGLSSGLFVTGDMVYGQAKQKEKDAKDLKCSVLSKKLPHRLVFYRSESKEEARLARKFALGTLEGREEYPPSGMVKKKLRLDLLTVKLLDEKD